MIKLSSIKTIFILLIAVAVIGCGNNNNSNESKPAKTVVDKTENEVKKPQPTEETKVVNDQSSSAQQNEPLPPEQLEKAKSILAEVNASSISAVDAEKIYKMHCASCHGFKGNMMVNGAKDLTKSKVDIINSVAQVYHGKGLMTPYKGLLKSEEIVAVCQYIETLRK